MDPRLITTTALGRWEAEWDRLVDRMSLPSPFLRSWWLQAAARTQPCILLVLQSDQLLGGLALQADRRAGVERLHALGAGALCPDHIDLVAAPDSEQEVASAVREWLHRPGERIIDIDGVADGSWLRGVLPGARRDVCAVAPFLRGAFAPTRNLRRVLQRARQRMSALGEVEHRRIEQVDTGLRLLRSLHAMRWGSRSAFVADFDRFAGAARGAAERGEFAVHGLRVGGLDVAVEAVFEVAGRVSFYQSGRDPAPQWRNAATLLFAMVIDDALSRGAVEVDLLRGDESYKERFTKERRPLWRFRTGTGPVSRAIVSGDRVLREMKRSAADVQRQVRFRAATALGRRSQ